MSKIHYFQRYSSHENTVTNNTLLLFARIYSYSTSKLAQLLNELTDESIDTGIEFTQQTTGEQSVPDGAIVQRSLKILVEAKVDSGTDADQLNRHATSFSNEHHKLLLLLTRGKTGISREQVASFNRKYPDVIFRHITYEEICDSLENLFEPYEYEMQDMVNDYIEYCNDSGLFDQSPYFLRIVPCGQSMAINKKHGIYFAPTDRGYTSHWFIGVYKDKSVQAIWELDSVFDVTVKNGHLEKVLVQGRDTGDYDDAILSIIEDARQECGYEIAEGHRFFCGMPFKTDFRKASKGGMQGTRLINLKDELGDVRDASQIADQLRGRTWS